MTPAQREVWELHQKGLTQKAICEKLGKARRTVRDLLARARSHVGETEARDPAIQGAMDAFGLVTEPSLVWFKDGKYSAAVPTKGADEMSPKDIVEMFHNIPTASPPAFVPETDPDELVVYPLFDAHIGMKAHSTISGEDYDLEIAKTRILDGLVRVMVAAPNSYRAVFAIGGDLTHQTDDKNMTRKSGHILDVACRNIFAVEAAIDILDTTIQIALTKHERIEIYSVPGNHDEQNWETILIGMRERYRDHEDVLIHINWEADTTSSEFTVIEHGRVAIFLHHGDKRTPKDLGMFLAHEFRDVWGRCDYCVLLTGHLHHLEVKEFPGFYWMQLPSICPRDKHAAGGYGSRPAMYALVFDRESETDTIKRILK